jgi:hypothetical protein
LTRSNQWAKKPSRRTDAAGLVYRFVGMVAESSVENVLNDESIKEMVSQSWLRLPDPSNWVHRLCQQVRCALLQLSPLSALRSREPNRWAPSDHNVSTRWTDSDCLIRPVACGVAGDSGIDPAIVYAMNKTGRIVTETNVHFLTDAELQEWNDAVDEYHQKVEAGETQ